jgi:hypothetical protein
LLGLQRNDLFMPMHDGAVGLDWPLHNLVAIVQVDDDDVRLRVVGGFLADADIVVGFKGLAPISMLEVVFQWGIGLHMS